MSGLCDLAEYPLDQRVAIARAELESLLSTSTEEVSPPVAEPVEAGIPIQHATAFWSSLRPLTNDERLAAWAAKYYSGGHHRMRPRLRIRHTAPGGHPARLSSGERYALEQAPAVPIHDYAAIRGE